MSSSNRPSGEKPTGIVRTGEGAIAESSEPSSSGQPSDWSLYFRSYEGPPPPDMLAQYNQVIPNLGDRLIEQFFIEAEHRRAGDIDGRKQTTKYVDASIDADKRGMWFAFILAIVFAGVASLALVLGHPATAAIILGSDLVALVATFIWGKKLDRNEAPKQDSEPPREGQ